mgnify:CR=1 FL=1
MLKIESVSELQAYVQERRSGGDRLALVSTMGALHAGHRALVEAARGAADLVIVSAFVNPLQLGPAELAGAYPRAPEADFAFCVEAGVDVLFAPSAADFYPAGFSTYVTEESYSEPLCGITRPSYFRGVTTLLAKLLNLVRPACLVMGQKDLQQTAVARKMIADLNYNVEVLVVPTVREADGLPCGARNRELTASQRQEATVVLRALAKAKEMVESGVRNTDRLVAEVTHLIGERRRVRVIYVSIVDRATIEAEREVVPGRSILAIAVWVDEVRLIDNIAL